MEFKKVDHSKEKTNEALGIAKNSGEIMAQILASMVGNLIKGEGMKKSIMFEQVAKDFLAEELAFVILEYANYFLSDSISEAMEDGHDVSKMH